MGEVLIITLIAVGGGAATAIINAFSGAKGRKITHEGIAELKALVESNHADVTKKLEVQDKKIGEVAAEVKDNGGNSMKDGVKQIRSDVKSLRQYVGEQIDIQNANATIFMNESIQDAAFRLDKFGQCTFANEKLVDFLGLPYNEITGRGFLKVIGRTQAERLAFQDQLMDSIEGGVPFTCDVWVRSPKAICECEVKLQSFQGKDDPKAVLFFYGKVKQKTA